MLTHWLVCVITRTGFPGERVCFHVCVSGALRDNTLSVLSRKHHCCVSLSAVIKLQLILQLLQL